MVNVKETPMRSRLTGGLRGTYPTETTTALADNSEAQSTGDVWAFRLSLAFLVLGAACRLHVYLLAFPIWRDEASLALNFVSRDFRGLLHELDHFQVAPLLFLWIEKAVYLCWGGSVLLLRLVPLLAGIAALVLFWRLARWSLAPLPAALAVGFLAVAQSSIHLASMVKPYSFDLFAAALLLILAIHYLRYPERGGCLAALALVVPFVVTASYPAVFVVGSVSLVLLPVVWQKGSRAGRCWFVAINVLCGVAVAAHLYYVGREIHDPTALAVQPYMAGFWKNGFLPRQPLAALHWLIRCHVGHMLAYPLAFNGGGLLGLLLCLVGAHALYRRHQFALLGLCLLPFALNFVAGALRRYPYAGDQRLEQHLVPGICLLLGSGIADLIPRLTIGAAWRKRLTASVAGAFVLIALAGAVDDDLHPYHNPEAAWANDIAEHLRREVRTADRIVLVSAHCFTGNCIRWQLLSFTEQMRSPTDIDWASLERDGGRIWFVDPMLELAPPQREPPSHDPRAALAATEHSAWHIVHRARFQAREPGPDEQVFHYCCDLHVLERGSAQARLAGELPTRSSLARCR
jgi:hypothetical protein